MLPLAPSRLSVTTGCPTTADRCWAYSLPTMSAGPPAGKGPIIWIGLGGKSSTAEAVAGAGGGPEQNSLFIGGSRRGGGAGVFFPRAGKSPEGEPSAPASAQNR